MTQLITDNLILLHEAKGCYLYEVPVITKDDQPEGVMTFIQRDGSEIDLNINTGEITERPCDPTPNR